MADARRVGVAPGDLERQRPRQSAWSTSKSPSTKTPTTTSPALRLAAAAEALHVMGELLDVEEIGSGGVDADAGQGGDQGADGARRQTGAEVEHAQAVQRAPGDRAHHHRCDHDARQVAEELAVR